MTDNINEQSPQIAAANTRWTVIRDVLDGSDAVKDKGMDYLPRASENQPTKAYDAYKEDVTFHPAALRTLAGLTGLITGKPPVMEGTDAFLSITDEISYNEESFVDVAEWALKETCAVNYGGILVDYPSAEKPSSQKEAEEQGFRPYISTYAAEQIVKVRKARIKNRDRLSYVELRDDDLTNRVLKLINGVYTVEIYKRSDINASFMLDASFIPKRDDGATLDVIPFVITNDAMGDIDPKTSTIAPVVRLNLDHYRIEGRITYIHYWMSLPIPWVSGVSPEASEPLKAVDGSPLTDEDGKQVYSTSNFKVGGHDVWVLSDAEARVGYAEFTGAGVASLERKRDKIEQRMAVVGAQILATEKAAAEAAETVAMRSAAQNSTLAKLARTVSRKMTNVARWVVWWQGGSKEDEKKTFFAFNTDYRVNTLSDQTINQLRSLNMSQQLSDETLFNLLKSGGIFPEVLTYKEELKRRQADDLAKPSGVDMDDEIEEGYDEE